MKPAFFVLACLSAIGMANAQTSRPLLSISRLTGDHGDQVTTAVYSGFTDSQRVKLTDEATIERTVKASQGNALVVRTPAYVITGQVNSVSFSGHSTTYSNKTTYYHDCEIVAELKLTNVINNESEIRSLNLTGSSEANNEEALLAAMRAVRGRAHGYARERFPASLTMLEVLKESERKGITSFRAEGEGLTVKGGTVGFLITWAQKTQVVIKHRRQLTRPDGTSRWMEEEIGRAKIVKVETSSDSELQTAVCDVTKGGEKLRELWSQKAQITMMTTED